MNIPSRILALIAFAAPLMGTAQTFQEYLQLRKQYGITRATDPVTVETFVGKRVLEVQGTVKGVIGSGDSEMLLVEGPSGVQHFIRAKETPDWLKNGQIDARMIVEAERRSDSAMLDARLIGAALEQDVAALEAKSAPAKAAPRTSRTKTTTSRSGGRPAPIPGDVPNPKTNSIGNVGPEKSAEMVRVLPQYVAFIKRRNPKLSDADATRIGESILAYSAHFGVDARLIVAIVISESNFDPTETSNKGAQGLGQLMPASSKALGLTDAYNIEQNLWGTIRTVRGQIDKYTDKTEDSFEALVLALAGYNAGNGAVRKYGGVPPYKETQNYVRKVIDIYRQLCGQ